MEELLEFLNVHKSKENFTHVSLVGGKYTIPYYRNEEFMELYLNAISKGKKVYLVERLERTFNYFMDLDFDEKEVSYVEIKKFVKEINVILSEVFELETPIKYVLSKNDKNYHINYPGLVVNSKICLGLLKRYIDLEYYNYIDHSVYKNNGLRMVGSRKSKENQKYYRILDDAGKMICLKDMSLECLAATSIRTDREATKTVEDLLCDDIYICKNKLKVVHSEIREEVLEYLEVLKKLPDLDINFIVRNIKVMENKGINHIYIQLDEKYCPFMEREHTRKCPPIYIDISKNGSYVRCYDMDCVRKMYPEGDGLPMPENQKLLDMVDYTTDISDEMTRLLEVALSGTHYDIAKVIEEYIGDDIRVDSVKNEEWYEYVPSKHRWVKTSRIRNILSTEIVELFCKFNKGNDMNKSINDICRNLKTVGFKTSIMSELAYVLNQKDTQFANKLDSNKRLMCFNNGVLDMTDDEIVFRNGRRNDYLSMCTGVDYYPYDADIHDIRKVESIFSEIFTEKEMMNYVLTVLSKCLVGEKEEVFYILNGSGSNGKSVTSSLIENSFGDYAGGASVALLTQKRNKSSAPSPEIVMLKGKRIVTMHEPEHDDELKVGLMKQMSGGDKIQARGLHKDPIEFVPQFKMFMNCNKLPKISANDDGTWRRMRVIEYKSKFVNSPKEGNKYEFKRDNDLMRKIDNLGSAFMSILVEYYNVYRVKGIEVPSEVMKFTNEYKDSSDVYSQFVSEMLELDEGYMSIDQLKGIFDIWWDDNMTERNKIKKIEFKKAMIQKIGKCIKKDNSLGWKVKVNNILVEDELDK